MNKELEQKRVTKAIKANLGAEVDLYCSAELAEKLQRLGDELRFVLIVSKATIHTDCGNELSETDVNPRSREHLDATCWSHMVLSWRRPSVSFLLGWICLILTAF